jgi:methyl-accepting chemotaxis protein
VKYSKLQQVIHWLIGLLVLCQLAIAVVLSQLRSLQFGQSILSLHRQMGFAILLVSVFRLVTLFRHKPPPLEAGLPPWQSLAARLVHFGFYVALIVQPIFGMCVAWGRGDAVTAFGLISLPAPWEISDAARDRFMLAHTVVAVALVGMVVVHVAAVVFNHWKRRVPVVERMLPSPPADQLVNRVPVAAQLLAALSVVIIIALATGINAIAKYRAFTQLTASYQETDQAASDETRSAQAAWKEIVGMTAAGSMNNLTEHWHSLVNSAATHLEEAATHVPDAEAHAAILSLIVQVRQVEVQGPAVATREITEIDSRLQEIIDNQAAAAQQAQGDIAERASRGHDLIVTSVLPVALLGIVLALLLARSMLGSLARLRTLVRGIEANSGSPDIMIHGRGEFAQLMRDMVSMRAAIERRTRAEADQRLALEADRAQAAADYQARQRETEQRRNDELLTTQRQAEQTQALERRALRAQLAEEFESQVASIVDSVAATIESLKNTAAALAMSAASTTQSSADASVVAETTKADVARIADSSSQLSATAQSVRENAEQSKARAVLGVQEASAARAEIDLLAVASGQINNIAEIISGVTRQTNLLAINARIEAARAGDAGRGFCIVADEVKTLAAQTKNATESIGGHVQQVGTAADHSINILKNMRSIITELEAKSTSIFSACDDQFRATEDIAAKVTQISGSSVAVAVNIAEAERTARATEAMAADVVDTADMLQGQADALRRQVEMFVSQLRSVNGRDARSESRPSSCDELPRLVAAAG